MVGLNIAKQLFCIQYGGRYLYPNLQRRMHFSSKDSEGNGPAGRQFRGKGDNCSIDSEDIITKL